MKLLCVLVVSALFGASIPLPAQAAVKQYQLNIPRQSLDSALKEFAKQTGLQVARFTDTGAAADVGPISGEFPVEEALRKLLEESGLTFEVVNERTIAVVNPADRRESTQRLLSARETTASEATKEESRSWFRRLRLAQADTPQSTVENQTTDSQNQKEDEQVSRKKPVQQEEVIVTARRRAENVQDVPISMAVVTADDISRRGLISAEDYLRGIPGANQVEGTTGQSIVIRGIESATTGQNFGSGPTTATYFGETQTTNTAGLVGGSNVDLKLVDIERVEVLRGPQGTAFGNSSMGGAVRTIPVAPKLDRFEGKVVAGYSGTSGSGGDNYNVQAVGNLPLITDKLGIRATGYRHDDSGFYRNVAGSDAAFQAAAVTPYGAQAFAIDEEEVGSYYAIGGRIAALFQASDDLRFTLSYLSQKTERDGLALANSGSYEQTQLGVAPEHVVRREKGGVFDTDIDIANAMMEYNLGWANLLATYSYVNSGSIAAVPFSYVNTNLPASIDIPGEHRERIGEIRLATQLDGPWDFLAGLYAEELKDESLADYKWHGDPATNPFDPNRAGVVFDPERRHLGTILDRRNLKQKAAFGEASWEFLPGFTLTGGVRAYEYDRTYRNDSDGAFFGVAGIHVQRDTKVSDTNFRANLSYKPDDGALLYAGWSQGFRLGRLQAGLPPGVCDLDGDGIVDGTNITIESTRRVNPDDVDSYELGGKFERLDRRLTIAADVFRMEWSGMPVQFRLGSAAGCSGLSYFANVGAALSEGVEFQANFQIIESFRIDFGGSWIHAKLTEDVPALNAFKGNRLPGSPELNGNLGLQYEFEIGGYKAFVRADSIYVGDFYGNLQESPNTKSGDYVKLDTSARVAIRNLNIDLFVHNLTNEEAFTFRGDSVAGSVSVGNFYGYQLRPRTIGLRLAYTF